MASFKSGTPYKPSSNGEARIKSKEKVPFECMGIIKYPDVHTRDLFRLADLDNNGSIDALDLHRLLTLAGINATEDEARDMISMAGCDLERLRWDQYRKVVLCDLQGMSHEQFAQTMAMTAPRASTDEMKQRLMFRQAMSNLVLKCDLNFERMVQVLTQYNKRQFKTFVNTEELCTILGADFDDEDFVIILKFFDPTEFGRHDIRMVMVALVASMDSVEVVVKGQFAFRAFRHRKLGTIGVTELEQIMRCACLSNDPEEMSAKAHRLAEALDDGTFDMKAFEDLVAQFPAVIFPFGGKAESDSESDEEIII